MLLISDDLPELLMNSDRIGVMHRGQLTRIAPVTDLSEASLTAELLEAVPISPAPQVGGAV